MTPTTPEAKILEALLGHLKTFSLPAGYALDWPGIADAAPGERQIRVQHLPNRTSRPFISADDPSLHKGILQLTVVYPVNQGELGAREIAGTVADHFDVDTLMSYGGITVRSVKRPDVAPSMPTGSDLLTPVSVEYESYI